MPPAFIAIVSAIGAQVGSAALILYAVEIGTVLFYATAMTLSTAYGNAQRRKLERAARDSYNAGLRDRLVMVSQANGPRSRVYGRVRNVDGVLFKATRGANSEFFTLIVAVAGHEVADIEQIYFDDVAVTLDSSGYVQTAPWAVSDKKNESQQSIVSAGANSITLPFVPIAGSVSVSIYDSNDPNSREQPTASIAGSVISWTNTGSGIATINYQYSVSKSYARVRKFMGLPTQDLSSQLVADFPLLCTASDKFAGIALLRIDFEYATDAFPTGVPVVSAVVKGAKLFDPRTGQTAWTENPSIIGRDWSLYVFGGNLPSAAIDAASILSSANPCDVATTFTTNKGSTVRPLFTCGIAIPLGSNPAAAMQEIVESMAGRYGYSGGVLSIRAGVYRAPILTITEDWLSDAESISIVPEAPIDEAVNVIRPLIADAALAYAPQSAPDVRAAAYIANDGRELPLEQQYSGITDTDHAQHVAAIQLREARSGLTVTLPCNFRAFTLQLFDVVSVTLPRFGWSAKQFEVVDWRFSFTGGINLTLRETAASIYTVDPVFESSDATPNTALPSPFAVPPIVGLTLASGTAWLLKQSDGTITSRLHVSWTPITNAPVVDSGGIEVRWGLAQDSEALWTTIDVPGGDSAVNIDDVRDGAVYIVKVRARNALARGEWCVQKAHRVIGKSARPPDVTGFTASVTDSGVLLQWIRNPEIDRGVTEVHNEVTWNNATLPIFEGDTNSVLLPRPVAGTYYFAVKHRDTTGNYSLNAATASVVVTGMSGTVVTWASIVGAGKPSDNATADLLLYNSIGTGQTISGNTVSGGTASWNTNTVSRNAQTGAAYCAWSASAGAYYIAGLDGDPTVTAPGAQYAIISRGDGNISAREYGAGETLLGTFAVNDLISIEYDGVIVRYLKNGIVLRSINAAPNQVLYFIAALINSTPVTTLSNIRFGPLTNLAGVTAQAAAAALAANNAQTSANASNAAIANLASDSILSPSEKPSVKTDYDVLIAEQAGIDAQALNYGVTTDKTAYDNSIAALTAYLVGLTGWNTIPGGDVVIVGSTFRAAFQSAYVARQQVLNAINAAAKARLGALATLNAVDTLQIAPDAATKVYAWVGGPYSGSSISFSIDAFSVTSATSAVIEFTGAFLGINVNGDAGNPAGFSAESGGVNIPLTFTTTSNTSGERVFTYVQSISISAGQTINFTFGIFRAAGNPINSGLNISARAALVKR